MISPRSQFIDLMEQGAIPVEKIGDALKAAKVAPNGKAWRTFIDQLLLWLGGLAMAFAVLFFIAFNWDDIGRFAKFGMVEGFIVLAIVAFCTVGYHSAAGKVSLLFATICLGVLLALYGQTYQTGADPWQLFFSWAMLMLPWAIIGRFSAIWIVWIALLNTSLILYYQTFGGILWLMSGSETGVLWLTFILNTLLLVAWELLAAIRHWLSERWALRLLATAGGVPLTWLVLRSIFVYDDGNFLSALPALAALAWVIWLAVMYVVYRRIKPDLFMLAGCCLSGITVIISYLGKHLLEDGSAGSFLVLALLVVGMGAGAAFWLKNVHRECQS
jgi:uncharacterized membrane protein